MTTSDELFSEASGLFPGGVNSPVRSFAAVEGTPVFIDKAYGPYLRDVEGNEYVDLVCSWGPAILGHGYEPVVEAVQEAAKNGLSFGAVSQGESELAALILQKVPCLARVRFVSTGTEATMTAIRLARGYTGKDKIIKFAGCYHGHSDCLLAEAGSGAASLSIPGSSGVPHDITSQTIVLPYNDLEAVEEAFQKYEGEIAAVITESAPCNMGVVPPGPGYNKALLDIARKNDALLISDEVLTGFRVSESGFWGIEGKQEGWVPDLMTFGKIMGGGLPAAALAGPAEIMNYLAPEGPVYQAGTLSGNPIAMAAGFATLSNCTPEIYRAVDQNSTQLVTFLTEKLQAAGLPYTINTAGSLFSLSFGAEKISNYAEAKQQDTEMYGRFFQEMLANGVYLPPSAFEAWFLSAAHDEAAMEKIYTAIDISIDALNY